MSGNGSSGGGTYRMQQAGQQMAGGTVKFFRRPGGQAPQTSGKLMRLRCRFRPLHDTYVQNGDICDRDSDVVFICPDGRIRAHKIILASAAQFFTNIFEDQKGGSMTSVIVPDIPVAIMRTLILLSYKESVTLTKKQMREVADALPLFGMSLKNFMYDDNTSGSGPNPNVQAHPLRPPPMMRSMQTGPNILQRQLGQPTLRPMTSMNAAGKGMIKTILGRPPVAQPKFQAQQYQQQLQAAGRRVSKDNEAAGAPDSEGSDEDYKFQLQGYDSPNLTAQQQIDRRLKQIRLSSNVGQPLPQLKPALVPNIQLKVRAPGVVPGPQPQVQYRRIAPKPIRPANSTATTSNNANLHEIQFEPSEDDDPSSVADPEQGRAMIEEWMQNVGRDENKKSQLTGPPADQQPTTSDSGPLKNQCLICNNVFENPEKWRWHETHHVGLGIFKCAFCDELFSTSRKVFQHEMMEHGVTGGSGAIDPPSIPPDFQILDGRKRKSPTSTTVQAQPKPQPQQPAIPRMTLVKTANGTHYRRAPASSVRKKIVLSKLAKYKKHNLARSYSARNPLIGIGMTDGEEMLDDRKIKQLHWVYVCGRCETCSDSLSKAQTHYSKCWPGKEEVFEHTVTKYRQGFFGRCKCPLCPRRYTTNHGFTIHCGHMHNDYRRKFNHSSADDSLICINCRRKFKDPPEFQYHIGEDGDCSTVPEYSQGEEGVKWVGNETPGTSPQIPQPGSAKSKPRASLVKKGTAPVAKAVPTPPPAPSSSLSRSTRLANRRTMNHEEEIPEENFTPTACPICGGDKEKKIVEHLKVVHPDLDMEVTRVSETALRCQKCSISFSICDLVAHNIFCTGSKQFQYVKERRIAAATGTPRGPKQPKDVQVDIPFEIPPGLGVSPVDVVEPRDLLSPEVVKAAMKCPVCGRTNKKFALIADCLRSHGIYRCALCFNSYSERATYSAHIRSCHTLGSGRLQCPLCPRNQFVNAGQVAGHMYGTHWLAILKDGLGVLDAPPDKRIKLDVSPAPPVEPQPVADPDGLAEGDLSATTTEEDDSLTMDLDDPGSPDPKSPPPDDYSNITLGSLLKSSDSPMSRRASAEEDKEAISLKDILVVKKDEGAEGKVTEGPAPAPDD